MMIENLGKKYSFRELLEDNDFSISIPLIQRDYVQGKENKTEVRNDFLDTLKKYLLEGENKDLDFVYGYLDGNKFIPLDGQQRLTTLFLLHTYLAFIAGESEKWKNIINQNDDFKFKYEVRRSSSEFCKDFVKYGIDFNHFEKVRSPNLLFADFVSNLHWFKLSWNQDPTISSMINMLSSIHDLFKDSPNLYERLVSKAQPVLTFLFLNLKDLSQGDELYIKMNARGKMLTNFENFKARFEEKIGVLFEKNDTPRVLEYRDKKISLTTKEYFSFKLDSVWSNLFWIYRDLVGNPHNYDDEIFNFIKEILIYHKIKNSDESNHKIDLILKVDLKSYKQLIEHDLISRDSVEYLINVFDKLQYDSNGVKVFCENKYFNETNLFKLILTHKIQNPDRVKYFAYLEFLLNEEFDISQIQNWMRVVSNLVENKILNSQEMIIPAFKSIQKLVINANRIIEHLTLDPEISFFENSQIIEEKIKAKIFIETPEFYSKIYKIEQSIFHSGQIGYLLELSGIVQNYDFIKNQFLDSTLHDSNLKLLMDVSEKSVSLFSYLDTNTNHLFERGILTYGNYLVKKGDHQYNFSSSKKVANYERDYSWKSMLALDFSKSHELEAKEKRNIFYKIINDSKFNFINVEKSLSEVILDFKDKKDWRYDFIHNPRYIEACGQGFIYTQNNNFNDIQLLNASQMNHLRMDLQVLKFWIQGSISQNSKYKHYLESVKGYNEVPFILTNGITHNRKNYGLNFYRIQGNKFYVRFYKTKGYNNESNYGTEIISKLKDLGFVWNNENFHKGYTFSSKTFNSTTNKYLELLTVLN